MELDAASEQMSDIAAHLVLHWKVARRSISKKTRKKMQD